MTLIIGVKCLDGIIFGADGVVTDATIKLKPYKKIKVISDNIVVACSGSNSISQRLEEAIKFYSQRQTQPTPGMAYYQVSGALQNLLSSVLKKDWEIFQTAKLTFGEQINQNLDFGLIMALPVLEDYHLLHFDFLCQPYEIKEELPFYSIGCGKNNADPFLAFIWRVIWNKKMPTLQDAFDAVLWTLIHVIEIAPYAIDEPIQIMRIAKSDGQYLIDDVDNSVIQEGRIKIQELENYILKYFKTDKSAGSLKSPDEL